MNFNAYMTIAMHQPVVDTWVKQVSSDAYYHNLNGMSGDMMSHSVLISSLFEPLFRLIFNISNKSVQDRHEQFNSIDSRAHLKEAAKKTITAFKSLVIKNTQSKDEHDEKKETKNVHNETSWAINFGSRFSTIFRRTVSLSNNRCRCFEQSEFQW